MIEPIPKRITPEQLSNRLLNIGIVLEEDHQQCIKLELMDCAIRLNGEIVISKASNLTLKKLDDDVLVLDVSGNRILCAEKIVFEALDNQCLEPTLCIQPLVIGRGFHWSKKITAKFPGDFVFTAKPNGLQVINTVKFEEYLACVVVSEMSSEAPEAFVKAQIVAARSWASCFLHNKHPDMDYDLCNDDDCQRYQGVTYASAESLKIAQDTNGVFLLDRSGTVLPAYYSKSCGGMSESAQECFGLAIADLESVKDGQASVSPDDLEAWLKPKSEALSHLNCGAADEDMARYLGPVDEPQDYFRWEHRESKQQLAHYLNRKTDINDAMRVSRINIQSRGPSGRVHKLDIGYTTTSGDEKIFNCDSQYMIRHLLHASFLYSSAFLVEDQGDDLLFRGAGWGHGVGLCQIGACFQATQGVSFEKILALYFPSAEIKRCY